MRGWKILAGLRRQEQPPPVTTVSPEQKQLADLRQSRQAVYRELGEVQAERDTLAALLERAGTILGNMADERTDYVWPWQRWRIHHEPLRGDAGRLLPLIDAALGGVHRRRQRNLREAREAARRQNMPAGASLDGSTWSGLRPWGLG